MEEDITLPTVTDIEVKKTLAKLVDTSDMPYISILIGIKKMKFSFMRSLNPILEQVCDCLLIKADIAAITLTNFLVERTLKLAVIISEGNGKTYSCDIPLDQVFKEEIERYDKNKMEQTINRAKSIGIITKEESEYLKDYKAKYRNPFSHAELQAILAGVTITTYETSLFNPTDIVEKEVNLPTTPLFQDWGLAQYCKKHSFDYFIEIFVLARKIEKRLQDLYESNKNC